MARRRVVPIPCGLNGCPYETDLGPFCERHRIAHKALAAFARRFPPPSR